MRACTFVFSVFAALVFVSGCLGRGGLGGGRDCPLPTANPFACVTGVVLVEDSAGCRTVKCLEDVGAGERVIEDLSGSYGFGVGAASLGESGAAAREYILAGREYGLRNGYGLREISEFEGGCPGCWSFVYRFDGDSALLSYLVDEYTVSVIVENGSVSRSELAVAQKLCESDGDCRVDGIPEDVIVYCENRVCKKKFADSKLDRFCRKNGGTVEVREEQYVGNASYCLFEDGTECEVKSYYTGGCRKGEGLRECEIAAPGKSFLRKACTSENETVCAKLKAASGPPLEVEWREYKNACLACTSSNTRFLVVGYRRGACPAEFLVPNEVAVTTTFSMEQILEQVRLEKERVDMVLRKMGMQLNNTANASAGGVV